MSYKLKISNTEIIFDKVELRMIDGKPLIIFSIEDYDNKMFHASVIIKAEKVTPY